MSHVVRMPAVMANETDAVLATWLTSPGQKISVGDPLAEIETDKAVVEYAAEVEGTVGQMLVEPGTRVNVGEPIVVILEAGEALPATQAAEAPPASPSAPPLDSAEAAPHHAASSESQQTGTSLDRRQSPPTTSDSPGDRLFVTPIARRIAAQRGIDLALLVGTGPNGRIVRRDVEAYNPRAAASAVAPVEPAEVMDDFTDVPVVGMRRAIARRLTESKTTIPHFYVTAYPRVDPLLALRQEINETAPRKISVNDFVVKAVAAAMVTVPAANAIWNEDSIRYFRSVDIAVAVSVPDGLLTPVIRGVDRLGMNELSVQIAQLADQARNGRLQQNQLEGGSFSVSNLGMYGVEEFSAIINPPHAGILAVSAAKPKPVVGDDGELGVATVMTVTLSVDHRVIDGTIAAQWIAALVAGLENPLGLLL